MSYQSLPYTYGALTEAQIDAIPTSSPKITAGSTVFNTDTQMIETYNGRIWHDERSLCFKIDSGVTVVKGNTLKTGTTGEVQLMTSTTSDRGKFCGIAVRSPISGYVAVAHCGKVQALAGATIVRGNPATPDSTSGRITDNTSTPTGGTLGVCLESGSNGNLVWIALQTIEFG
jgi:hypothetical protein